MKSHEFLKEDDDADLFGTPATGTKSVIASYAKKMLFKLEQAFEQPEIREQYKAAAQNDADALFDLILKITGAPANKAFIVDTILRTYSFDGGLTEFGSMIEDGTFTELTGAIDDFIADDTVEQEDWYQREVKKFMGSSDMKEADEPKKQQKAKTKDRTQPGFSDYQNPADNPLQGTDPLDDLKKKAGVRDQGSKLDIKKASRDRTLSATRGITPTDDMANMLGRMRNIEIDPNLEPYPADPEEPELLPSVDVSTANLPAVANRALQAAGVQSPDFHQVANLPNNMMSMIRQLGVHLFGSMTTTPTKRIYMIANLGGHGPNTNREVQAVANFLKQNGQDRGPGDVDFDAVMPGYTAETHAYTAAGIRWLLVRDFAGQYIYCWPESDSHDAAAGLTHDQPRKELPK
jgi:hypothetical protein